MPPTEVLPLVNRKQDQETDHSLQKGIVYKGKLRTSENLDLYMTNLNCRKLGPVPKT